MTYHLIITRLIFTCIAIVTYPAIASSVEFCEDDDKTEELFPDYQVVMDWGIRIDDFHVNENYGESVTKKRTEIEYEYNERIIYEEDPISITKLWQECESFIGRQEKCISDYSHSLVIDPDLLESELESRQNNLNSKQEYIMEFPQYSFRELDSDWEPSETPLLETMFNLHMTTEEIESLGDFKQLSFRQAIRVTVDIDSYNYLIHSSFDDFLVPNRFKFKSGLFINSRIILKNSYKSFDSIEKPYIPFRIMFDDGRKGICFEETCGFEYLAYDTMTVNEILGTFNGYSSTKGDASSYCHNNGIEISAIDLGDPEYLNRVDKAVFHYEIQTSIINANAIENFRPLDYMERNLTLPSNKDTGSLYYLLLLGVFAFFRRNNPSRIKNKTPTT